MSIGAPPDLLSTDGQNWGLAAFSPTGLRESGYRAFLEMLRHAMRHAGGVRIDHALGLARLWVVPDGASAKDGAYIAFPLTDLLRLIALESTRNKAIVLGEDLGTIPEGFQDRLADAGTLGMRVLWFEKKHDLFTDPATWTPAAAAMTSTHDLATVAGWWSGRDLQWRSQLGVSRRTGEARAGGSRAHPRPRRALGRLPTRWRRQRPGPAARRGRSGGRRRHPSSRHRRLPARHRADRGRARPARAAEPPGHAGRTPELAAAASMARPRTCWTPPHVARRLAPFEGRRLRMKALSATARLQFHKGFTLDDAAALVPYFSKLGISHMYASPILKARAGSMHGYDIVDHNLVNPELGGEEALRRLVTALRAEQMGLILDIVPNHMGVGGNDNGWWLDVLEWGRSSAHAEYFDIDWDPPDSSLRGPHAGPLPRQPLRRLPRQRRAVAEVRPG